MKLRIALLLVVTGGVVGWVYQSGRARAVASDQASMAAVPLAMSTVAGGDFEYAGSKKCKRCHSKQYKSWETTTHAKALDILKPGERKEAKEKYKLDPAKDYSTDKSCLACHAIGFGKTGGYAVPAADDEKAAKKMKALAGVGCESCHGPGKAYCVLKKAIKKEKRNYKSEELMSSGMIKIEAATCTVCHNDKSPTYDESKAFDYNKRVKEEKAVHVHIPLKLKEG